MRIATKTHLFLLISLTFVGLLAACSKTDAATLVADFVKDPMLLKKTVAACEQNPGELAKTPNCVNANSANAHILLAKYTHTGVVACFKTKNYDAAPNIKCIDDYFAKNTK